MTQEKADVPHRVQTGPYPELDAAQIATQMVSRLGEARVIGPVLTGLAHAVQVVPMDAKVSDLVIYACLAAAQTSAAALE